MSKIQADTLLAVPRAETGKAAVRRMRREALPMMPAIIYGGGKAAEPIAVAQKDIAGLLRDEGAHSRILTLKVGRKTTQVILKDIQRHPTRQLVLHADFHRIDQQQQLTVRVPLNFLGEEQCIGVRQQGGVLAHMETDVEVRCLPADLPEFIEVDVSDLELGSSLHLSDLDFPDGVTSTALLQGEEHDLPVANVHQARTAEIEEEEEGLEDEVEEAQSDDSDQDKSDT